MYIINYMMLEAMMTDEAMRRLSGGLAIGATVLAALIPLAALGIAARGGLNGEALLSSLDPLPPGTEASRGEVLICLGLAAVAVLAAVWALDAVRRLFTLYAQGRALTIQAARVVGEVGRAVTALAVLGVLVPALQGLIVTFDNPAGARELALSIGTGSIGLLLAGGVMTVMGVAMRQAAAQRAELEGFV